MLTLFLTLAMIDKPGIPPEAELLPPPQVEIVGYYAYEVDEEKGVAVIQLQDGLIAYGIGRRDGNGLWVSWKRGQSFGLARYRIEVEKDRPKLVGEVATTEVMRGLK